MTAVVHLTANHNGWFEFRVCPTNDPSKHATQGCLNQHVLKLADYTGSRYEIQDQSQGLFRVRLQLPRGLACSHCVLQWHYTSGNNWGFCKNGDDMMGCGKQEVFRGCSDIAIFDQNDHSYYKYLNLTSDFDLQPIINLEDGMYLPKPDSKKNNDNDDYQDHRQENPNDEHDLNSVKENKNAVSSDDLSKLDDDGDGVINIDGNLLTLDALKSHLLASGLITSSNAEETPKGSSNIESSIPEYTSTTFRSRSKFRVDPHKKEKRRGGNRKATKKRTYVTPRTNVKEPAEIPSDAPDGKNSVYVPSNTFRKSNFESSHQEISTKASSVRYATEASNTEEYTLGPVVVHRPLKSESERVSYAQVTPSSLSSQDAGSRGVQTSNDVIPRGSRGSHSASFRDVYNAQNSGHYGSHEHISSSHKVKPFVPEPEDVLPEILSQLSSLKDYSRANPTSSEKASSKTRVISTTDRLLEAVKTILTVSQVTTPSPVTQMQRIASQEKTVSIPNIIVDPNSGDMVSFGFRRKTTSADDHTFPQDIFSTITESVTRSSRRSKPQTKPKTRTRQSRPRTATPQTLLDAQATIQNLAAQTKLFSKQKLIHAKPNTFVASSPKPSGHVSWEQQPSSFVTWKSKSRNIETQTSLPHSPVVKTPLSSIASQALFPQASDMSGAMAFQVPLSKLRDSVTLDKLFQMKLSLLPESEREVDFDPILLIIM
ncbi:Cellulose/chitin-binding protein N-terminal [Trinorchestia longiramus]|nr:Cellulose/chitin-binding protein N-terminal [Trinorchestia longiramus]